MPRADIMSCSDGQESRLKKQRREAEGADGPQTWMDDAGIHSIVAVPPPTVTEEAVMTAAYQERIRKSPLWDQMVREYGAAKAAEMLKEFPSGLASASASKSVLEEGRRT
jgi:hypothetical protein